MIQKEQNKKLIERYPFLSIHKGEYEFTWLDSMPDGWRNCFGLLMCEDILNTLTIFKIDPKTYKILQIKEKYGSLRWYDNGCPNEVSDIIDKYEFLSKHTCIMCGKLGVPVYGGWISPYCDDCAKKIYKEPLKDHQVEEGKLEMTFGMTTFSNQGNKERILDISDIVHRIDDKFKDKFKEGLV